jgi:hypothetical protein
LLNSIRAFRSDLMGLTPLSLQMNSKLW